MSCAVSGFTPSRNAPPSKNSTLPRRQKRIRAAALFQVWRDIEADTTWGQVSRWPTAAGPPRPVRRKYDDPSCGSSSLRRLRGRRLQTSMISPAADAEQDSAASPKTAPCAAEAAAWSKYPIDPKARSEEHTSELQSRPHL